MDCQGKDRANQDRLIYMQIMGIYPYNSNGDMGIHYTQ